MQRMASLHRQMYFERQRPPAGLFKRIPGIPGLRWCVKTFSGNDDGTFVSRPAAVDNAAVRLP